MKKKIVFIIISVLLMVSTMVYTGIKIYKESHKTFVKSGYILNAEKQSGNFSDSKSVKYYFEKDTGYKAGINNTIKFEDTNGEKVKVDDDSFVHYNDGSISLLKKGVILNLDEVSHELPKYYNLFEGTILEYSSSSYVVDNLGKKLKFDSFIVRISENKYLLVSDGIKLKLGESEVISLKENYVEFSFIEEGIIKIENESAAFQTIVKDAKVIINDDLYLNLDNEYFFYKDENKLNLKQIIINSNDNIDITPLEKEEDTDASLENNNENTENGESNSSGEVNEGSTGNFGFEEEVFESELKPPTAAVTELIVSSTMIEGSIAITDNDSLISGPAVMTLIEASTGKTVYSKSYEEGKYSIDFMMDNLKSNNVYNLTLRITYTKDSIQYTMDIIQQVIITNNIGISIEKDYYTTNALNFLVNIDSGSGIKNAKVSLYETNGTEPINYTEIAVAEEDLEKNLSIPISFDSNTLKDEPLNANTKYIVKIEEIFSNNMKLNNVVEMGVKTLKRRPEVGTVDYEINKKSSSFILKLNKMLDIDNGIERLLYEVYDVNGLNEGEDPFAGNTPVKIIETNATSVELLVDDATIKRNNNYVFRVIAQFYDNEKYVEYVMSLTSSVMNMEGRRAPYLSWSPHDIGWEHINGTVTINNAEAIVQRNDVDYLLVTFTNTSLGTMESWKITMDSNNSFPIDKDYLIADSNYTVSVTGPVDFGDGKGVINSYHIGSFMIKTEAPNPIKAKLVQNMNTSQIFEVNLTFDNLEVSEGNTDFKELKALTYYTVSLYKDMKSAEPMYTKKINDKNLKEFESDFAEPMYSLTINLSTFGVTESEFLTKYGNLTQYVVKVEKGYDYVYDFYKSYGYETNEIPITNNYCNVIANINLPLPSNPDNSVRVTKIKNNVAGNYGLNTDSSLDNETIVGLQVEAIMGNINYPIKSITYNLWDTIEDPDDKNGYLRNKLISSNVISPSSGGSTDYKYVIPIDEKIIRGKRYFITYTAVIQTDAQTETMYPEGDVVLSSSTIWIPKEEHKLSLFVADSSYDSETNTANFKVNYKLEDPDNTFYTNIDGKKLFYADIYTLDVDGIKKESTNNKWTGELNDDGKFHELEFSLQNIDSINDNYVNFYVLSGLYIDEYEPKSVFEQLYEGNYTVPTTLNYLTNYDESQNLVLFDTSGFDNSFFNRLTNYKVSITIDSITKDIEIYNFTNFGFSIDLLTIKRLFDDSDLVGKTLKADVYAYYDSGEVSFSSLNSSDRFVLKDSPKSTKFNYYSFDDLTKINSSSSAIKSNFKLTMNNSNKSISMLDYNNHSIELAGPFEFGYTFMETNVITNRIASKKLTSTNTNQFVIKEIIGVDMTDDYNNVDYTKGIDNVEIHPIIYGLKNDTIIKISYSFENNEIIDSFELPLSEISDKTYKINNLEAGQTYYILFSYYDEEKQKYIDIYDLNQNSEDKTRFKVSTLSDVGINFVSNNNTIMQKPDTKPSISWSKRNIIIDYTVDLTTGYDGLRYKLYYNEPTSDEWNLFSYNLSDSTSCQNGSEDFCSVPIRNVFDSMKLSIDYYRNSIFNFSGTLGRKYKLEIIPVIDNKELAIATAEYYFTLPIVSEPIIRLNSAYLETNSNAAAKLQLAVEMKDPNNVLYTQTVDELKGKYFITSVEDENGVSYKYDFIGKGYSTNKVFYMSNVDMLLRYKIKVNYQYDANNDGKISNNERKEYTYTTRTATSAGIDFGEVTYSVQNNQFVLYFEDCNISSAVDEIIYIIVDNNIDGNDTGKDVYHSGNAVLEPWGMNGRKIVLPSILEYIGSYHIQANFYVRGNEVGSVGINAMYNVG